MSQTDRTVEFTVDYDGDQVEILAYNPADRFGPPVFEPLPLSADEVHDLEKALRDARLECLGMCEYLINVTELQAGDIIADLGFMVARRGDMDRTEVRVYDGPTAWDSDMVLIFKPGRQIKVNRRG